jgi:sulfite reductase (ferredoxin)
MGKDLKLSQVKEEAVPAPAPKAEPAAPAASAPVYDLRGVACPMNYVKTKLKLEMMDNGEQLEVWLDAGEPIRNVPMSLRNDGHKILAEGPLEPEAKHFKILVEKVEG